jgi:hypothetical protein
MELTLWPAEAASHYTDTKEPFLIVPIADIQYGAQGCNVELLRETIEKATKMGAWFLGLGDYVDVASPSQRKGLASLKMYDSTRDFMDDQADANVKGLMAILGRTKGRWLGMLRGHHYWPYSDGTTSDTRLANALNAKFLGDCAAILIRFGFGTKGHMHYETAKIWCHHGAGGGQTAGAPLNKLEHALKVFSGDIYLMAHQHKLATTKLPWVDYNIMGRDKIRMTKKDRILACVGSFLKGYEHGSTDPAGFPAGSYVEKGMLTPTTLGCPTIIIESKDHQGYGKLKMDIRI